MTSALLTTTDHNRNRAGLTYIYPVISRRAGGLSIGVNFNTNNACNWRCIYCQVPGLKAGGAPELDFDLLDEELRLFLTQVLQGDFYDRFQIDPAHRVIRDIALSGNGEPTSVRDFERAVGLIGRIATELGVFPDSRFVLITNGSLIHQPKVQAGLRQMKKYGGEVWYKLDSATEEGRRTINHSVRSVEAAIDNLKLSSRLCGTRIQTCLLDYRGQGFSGRERSAYLHVLQRLKIEAVDIRCVMLYSIARPSMQPEAGFLRPVSPEIMNDLAEAIRRLGYEVQVAL